ncbi:aspartate aminotransferase family protein [Deinococcus sp. QL22]|uniref:class-III pyridoxal-phosphate-dependent aminotransferase n=1 Tax=Deinococcus sp. QL22 TaxID=2939437 RepID=UPI002017ED38|nr:aminotransferase class III-fold pyridoxal phosphate-dependent enzyme [Deinococcus sp. QL22]UQN08147.1 aminotransferase class III-fold pyridoxal phosphate-dependent enzyme [Deinococcus sp. QL22]
MTSMPLALHLPIRSGDLLNGDVSAAKILAVEEQYGNGDLIRTLRTLGIAGPFRVITPWELEDEQGVQRINAGGYAALPFGDRHPALITFLQDWLARDASVGLPQQAASAWRGALEAALVSLLARFAPEHADSRVFFSNSGAEAVETAVKFARAYRRQARHIINFSGAYHGKTHVPLSLTPNKEYQAPFGPLMADVTTVPYGDGDAFSRTVTRLGPRNIVAVILEPVQGESGVHVPPKGFLALVGAVCEAYGIVSIADEVQTGLGRTGHWFASVACGLNPDIVTLAKPLGGGLVPIGATIARKAIFEHVLQGFQSKRHSNTFGGNTLAMAVGLKSLELLVDENLTERSRALGVRGLGRLQEIQQAAPNLIEAVRGAGSLFALQFRPVLPLSGMPGLSGLVGELSGVLGLRLLHEFGVQANLSLSSKRVVRLTPAMNMPDAVFDTMLDRVAQAARSVPTSGQMLARTPPRVLMNLGRLAVK